MKKRTVAICAAALALGLVAPRDADAQDIKMAPVTTTTTLQRLVKILTTKVTGNINLNLLDTKLQGIQCSDITVYAQSVDMVASTSGGFAGAHKWTRSVLASGASPNVCSYTITVPGNSAFNLSLGHESIVGCQLVQGYPSPDMSVKVTVPTGTTKTFNWTAAVSCQNIY